MPVPHITKQNETVDLVCLAVYGRTGAVTEAVLLANPGLAALGPILPLGTQIVMPDISPVVAAPQLTSLWD